MPPAQQGAAAKAKRARVLVSATASDVATNLGATTTMGLGAGGAQPRWQTSGGVGTSSSQVLFPSNSDNEPTASDDEMAQMNYEQNLDSREPTSNQRRR